MPVSVPAAIVAIVCLTCDKNDDLLIFNATIPGTILPLPARTPAADALTYPKPTSVPSYYPYAVSVIQDALNGEATSSQASVVAALEESAPSRSDRALSHEYPIIPSLRQEASPPAAPAQGMISTLTSIVGGFDPYLRRPETAAEPVQAPPTKKVEEEKAVHLDHEHASEPAESLPDGVVSGGFYYEGKKANGEYFNEEMQDSESLEVHSHDQVSSPGKFYDNKSDHPYYVVDRPAEGPAPPPLMYFSSGLRSEDVSIEKPAEVPAQPPPMYFTSRLRSGDVSVEKPVASPERPPLVYFTSGLRSNDATIAAWGEYYAKLRQYYDQYYPSFRRSGRAKDETTIKGVQESVENQMSEGTEKSDD